MRKHLKTVKGPRQAINILKHSKATQLKINKIDGKEVDYYPASLAELAKCEPVYEELPGWNEDITGITDFEKLPVNAQNYLNRLTELTGIPLATISVGPDRLQTLILQNPWGQKETVK